MPFKVGFDRTIHPTSAMILLSDVCVIAGKRTLSRPPFSIAIETGRRGAMPRMRAWEERTRSAIGLCYSAATSFISDENLILVHTHAMSEQRPWSALSVLAAAWLSFVFLPPVSAVHPFNDMFIRRAVLTNSRLVRDLVYLPSALYRNRINRTNERSALRETGRQIRERKSAAEELLHWNGKRNWCVPGNAIFMCVNASAYKCHARLKRHKESQIININVFKYVQDTLTPSICNKDLEILYQ